MTSPSTSSGSNSLSATATSTSQSHHLLKFFKKKKGDKSASSHSSNGSSATMPANRSAAPAAGSPLSSGAAGDKCTFRVGVAEDANRKYRRSMEDSHTYIYNFADRPDWGYFGVFDGHAGHATAEWCSKNLHTLAAKYVAKYDSELTPGGNDRSSNIPHALYSAFTDADERIGALGLRNSGCTAAVAILRWEQAPQPVTSSSSNNSKDGQALPDKIRKLYVANVGDTRVVLSRGGKALRLTYDHKGSDPYETKRIVNLGGIVVGNRVNGVLAVTRSLGDSCMKEFVTGSPYTTETTLSPSDQLIIIACDGLWDVCDDQTACKIIQGMNDPDEAAKVLIKYALEHGSSDNLTCMVVLFDWKTKTDVTDGGSTTESASTASTSSPSAISSSKST